MFGFLQLEGIIKHIYLSLVLFIFILSFYYDENHYIKSEIMMFLSYFFASRDAKDELTSFCRILNMRSCYQKTGCPILTTKVLTKCISSTKNHYKIEKDNLYEDVYCKQLSNGNEFKYGGNTYKILRSKNGDLSVSSEELHIKYFYADSVLRIKMGDYENTFKNLVVSDIHVYLLIMYNEGNPMVHNKSKCERTLHRFHAYSIEEILNIGEDENINMIDFQSSEPAYVNDEDVFRVSNSFKPYFDYLSKMFEEKLIGKILKHNKNFFNVERLDLIKYELEHNTKYSMPSGVSNCKWKAYRYQFSKILGDSYLPRGLDRNPKYLKWFNDEIKPIKIDFQDDFKKSFFEDIKARSARKLDTVVKELEGLLTVVKEKVAEEESKKVIVLHDSDLSKLESSDIITRTSEYIGTENKKKKYEMIGKYLLEKGIYIDMRRYAKEPYELQKSVKLSVDKNFTRVKNSILQKISYLEHKNLNLWNTKPDDCHESRYKFYSKNNYSRVLINGKKKQNMFSLLSIKKVKVQVVKIKYGGHKFMKDVLSNSVSKSNRPVDKRGVNTLVDGIGCLKNIGISRSDKGRYMKGILRKIDANFDITEIKNDVKLLMNHERDKPNIKFDIDLITEFLREYKPLWDIFYKNRKGS